MWEGTQNVVKQTDTQLSSNLYAYHLYGAPWSSDTDTLPPVKQCVSLRRRRGPRLVSLGFGGLSIPTLLDFSVVSPLTTGETERE